MQHDPTPPNPSRRRLTKGGLAAPVVLASLASKNAFAAAPYLCTISGAMSGNLSPHGPADGDSMSDCRIGQGRSGVQTSLDGDGTDFNKVFRSSTPLYFTNGNDTKATLLGGQQRSGQQDWRPATLYNILRLTDYDPTVPPRNPELAKKAIVLWKNATTYAGSDFYPVTADVIIEMFKKAISNENYVGSTSLGSFTWTPAEVETYFDKLYIST